ncbi:MAG: HNH endonuclease [bacterium]|nr:HNH endonuclease [bacterium]
MHHTIVLPAFTPDQPATRVDAALREALAACDRARECAVLWFAEVQRRALYREFGHATLELYATQSLGFTQNRYWQFKRLADDLERLPVLREAVASGELGWTKAQQVARVATPETQHAWVAKAATTGRRELAREVQAARDVARLDARRAVALEVPPADPMPIEASFTLRGDVLQVARLEALLEKARKQRRGPTGATRLDLVLEALAALVDGPADDAGDSAAAAVPRPGVQVVVQQCPDCKAATVATARGDLALAPAQVEAVTCDAIVRGEKNHSVIPPRTRAAVLARDRHRCATPGCRATRFLEVHHVVPRSKGGGNGEANLVTLCSRCHGFVHERGEAAAFSMEPRQGDALGVPSVL